MADGKDDMPDDEESLGIEQTMSEESVQEFMTKRKRCGLVDGLNMEDMDSYLRREPLVEKAIDLARQSGLLVVSSHT